MRKPKRITRANLWKVDMHHPDYWEARIKFNDEDTAALSKGDQQALTQAKLKLRSVMEQMPMGREAMKYMVLHYMFQEVMG